MISLKEYPIYKKRDGQSWKQVGYIYEETFEQAKKQFANNCWNDLLNGKHGDNFIELSSIEDEVEEDGIYYEYELFFPKSNLENGIDFFTEDVYQWELRDNKMFQISCGTLKFTETFSSLEIAKDNYPESNGWKVVEIEYQININL